ncbi:MAG TPA: TetR/AcrR family transcriptional regulator [Steroidobacteraceae bacterium]|jgi:AcrR family transcriptional regulator|nr:TetR/AcrR family transcriptional regulator [Steroidobacteraceae bacterium]
MKSRKIRLKPRKVPKQSRSRKLVEYILEAAIRVLKKSPGSGFNTIAVASEAGVSVGSLYQYFPNKEALLFQLQMDEATKTREQLQAIFSNCAQPAHKRMKAALEYFFESEWEERDLRRSLQEASVDVSRSEEFSMLRVDTIAEVESFLRDNFRTSRKDSQDWAEYLCFSASSLAEAGSNLAASHHQYREWSKRSIEMLMLYMKNINNNA